MVEKYVDKIQSNPLADPYYKFQAALALTDIGDLSKSLKIVTELSARDARNLDYLNWLAKYNEQSQNLEHAIFLRKEIIKYDPWNAVNYLALGKIYKAKGDLVNAKLMFDKINSFASTNSISAQAKIELA